MTVNDLLQIGTALHSEISWY